MMGQIDIFGHEEKDALTYEDKIREAQDVLTLASEISMDYYKKPLVIAYSGGKDSDVLYHIALSCMEPKDIELLNSHTTVDAPETVRHIEKVFRQARDRGVKTSYHNRYPVKTTMWELIEKKRMPPTGLVRYFCAELKESSTGNRMTALGVREDESTGRRGRDLFR